MAFTEEQMQRYSRHLILKGVGVKGQQKLLESKVLVIGAGGLGSPAILYLAASGVGTIGIVDGDCVDLTNLQRQIIHDMDSLGVEKAESAVFNTCKHFIRTLPNLVYDESNVEDIDTRQEDHIYDECRYVLMENPISPPARRTALPPPDDPLDLHRQARFYRI